MIRSLFTAIALAALSLSASAASLKLEVVDQSGKATADAIVYATPIGAKAPAMPPAGAVVDQIRRRFVPLVSVVQTGASVKFPNKDNIEHAVYSFSPAKKFELNLYHGVPANPVVFDKPGLVVLGCNIHDAMIAYVLVVDTPYFAKTDDGGAAQIGNLPPGTYELAVWHPQIADGNAQPTRKITVTGDSAEKMALSLKAM